MLLRVSLRDISQSAIKFVFSSVQLLLCVSRDVPSADLRVIVARNAPETALRNRVEI